MLLIIDIIFIIIIIYNSNNNNLYLFRFLSYLYIVFNCGMYLKKLLRFVFLVNLLIILGMSK